MVLRLHHSQRLLMNYKYGDKFKGLIWDKVKKEEFHKQLVIILNGRTYRGENFLETPLKDGDDLSFLYVYFGG